MPSLGAAIRAFSREGEGGLVMPPVYNPFFDIIRDNARVVVEAPLFRSRDGRRNMDTADMERAVREAERRGTRTSFILISSPHNPVGRVWTRGELDTLLEFAGRHEMAIVCDEIHCDIVFEPNRFVSLAAEKGSESAPVVVLSGPNKTFNLAGLHISHAVVRGEDARRALKRSMAASGFHLPNVFSMTAALAAYRTGAAWLEGVLGYIRENYRFMRDELSKRFPGTAVSPLEGTYLAWVDFSVLIGELGLENDVRLVELLEEDGRVRFSAGSAFGTGGAGHIRINLACPRSMLAEGIERTAAAVSTLRRAR
jgi:cystathionine beta-lyase